MKKLFVLLLVVVLSMPVLADVSGTSPFAVDVNGRNGNPTKAGYTAWFVTSPWNSPFAKTFDNGVTATLSSFGSTAGTPSDSRERDGGMAFVAGTSEYGVTTKGFGTHYLKLTISGLTPDKDYSISLWSYEIHSVWTTNAGNPDSKFGVWSTLNPMDWLSTNYSGVVGEPPLGGYGPKVGSDHPGATTDTNMPAAMIAAMTSGGNSYARASIDQHAGATDNGDFLLGAWENEAKVAVHTNPFIDDDFPGGDFTVYGWIDATDWAGSMHMLLNGFRIVPEPTTIALLSLGGLALIRRKRA